MSMGTETSLAQEIKRLRFQEPIEGASYHWITLLGVDDKQFRTVVDSTWAGFTDTKPRREIREAALIDPQKLKQLLIDLKQDWIIVNSERDMVLFRLLGGNGIIEKSLAKKHFPHLVKPQEVLQSYTQGWLYVDSQPETASQHAPTKKLRMEILKRDGYRCKICGRSPKDYVDVELHVHHIIPWGDGAITGSDNLITICKTCHDGLEPHRDENLFDLIDVEMRQKAIAERENYWEGVRKYRKMISKLIAEDHEKE
jgi:hypothetical protein